MLFTKRQVQEKPTLKLGNDNLQYVEKNTFLGLIFDQHLTWKPHINFIKQTFSKLLDFLKVIANHSWGADTVTHLQVYKMIIILHLQKIVPCPYLSPISSLHCLENELPITLSSPQLCDPHR